MAATLFHREINAGTIKIWIPKIRLDCEPLRMPKNWPIIKQYIVNIGKLMKILYRMNYSLQSDIHNHCNYDFFHS